MTGRLYGRLGIFPGVLSPLSKSGLQLNETTIATALKKVGYRTGGLGKWHCTFCSASLFHSLWLLIHWRDHDTVQWVLRSTCQSTTGLITTSEHR